MDSTLTWVVWAVLAVGTFAFLEWKGLRSGTDKDYTLTNRIRALMRVHPVLRWLLVVGITGLLAWLAHHFLLVDPVLNHGA